MNERTTKLTATTFETIYIEAEESLNKNGYFYYPNGGFAVLEALFIKFGAPIAATDIKVRENSTRFINNNVAIPPHNEQPEARFVLWLLEQKAESGGVTYLIDGNTVSSKLNEATIKSLESIECNIAAQLSDLTDFPVLSILRDGKQKWFYSPWNLKTDTNNKQANSLGKLDSVIHDTAKIEFLLESGDILMVDNERMFHGRTEYQGERLLRRFLI